MSDGRRAESISVWAAATANTGVFIYHLARAAGTPHRSPFPGLQGTTEQEVAALALLPLISLYALFRWSRRHPRSAHRWLLFGAAMATMIVLIHPIASAFGISAAALVTAAAFTKATEP